jgi:hypothetical protein
VINQQGHEVLFRHFFSILLSALSPNIALSTTSLGRSSVDGESIEYMQYQSKRIILTLRKCSTFSFIDKEILFNIFDF